MISWQAMTEFRFDLADEPGAVGRFGARLRAADVNLLGLVAEARGDGTAEVRAIPEVPAQFRAFAESSELRIHEGTVFRLDGADRPGALVETLETIAARGVNLRRIVAIVHDGAYGCFAWADPQDWNTLLELLG